MSIDFEALKPELAKLCQKYGLLEVSVFGSAARGDERPESDVDLLYVGDPERRLGYAWFDIYGELEQLFGRQVDLLPKENLHWIMRDRVLADARVLYAAATSCSVSCSTPP